MINLGTTQNLAIQKSPSTKPKDVAPLALKTPAQARAPPAPPAAALLPARSAGAGRDAAPWRCGWRWKWPREASMDPWHLGDGPG